jgi:hypothetical protein
MAPWVARASLLLFTYAAAALVACSCLSGCEKQPAAGEARPISPGTALGGPGTGPGAYNKPRAIDTDGTNLFVIDRSGRVQVIDPADGHCLAWFVLQETKTGFPTGLTIAPSPENDGSLALWIPETHAHRVTVYAMPALDHARGMLAAVEPRVLARFGSYGSGPGQFIFPAGIEVMLQPDGKTVQRVFVSEFGGNDRVSTFAPEPASPTSFAFVSAFGSEGAPSDLAVTFQRPQTVHLLPSRVSTPGVTQTLLITDSINHRLGHFNLDGSLIRWIGAPDQFTHPRGLTLLPASGGQMALVVEFGKNRVQAIDIASGASLGTWGHAGRGTGELAEPWALAIINDQAFIADALNHRLVRMDLPRLRVSGASADGLADSSLAFEPGFQLPSRHQAFVASRWGGRARPSSIATNVFDDWCASEGRRSGTTAPPLLSSVMMSIRPLETQPP